MTYRELIEICYKTPDEKCRVCECKKECGVFADKTGGGVPVALYDALNINLDDEIEVKE